MPSAPEAPQEGCQTRILWPIEEFGSAALLRDEASVHEHDAACDLTRERHLVRDDHHRHALVCELPNDREHFAHELGVECGRDLVEEEHAGRHGERASDRDALRLAAGKVAGVDVALFGKADFGEERLRNIACLGLFEPEHRHWPFHDVLKRGHMWEEVELLEDHPDVRAQPRLRPDRNSSPIELETGVADAHASSIGLFEKIDAAQERRLAAAGGSDDELRLPALDKQ